MPEQSQATSSSDIGTHSAHNPPGLGTKAWTGIAIGVLTVLVAPPAVSVAVLEARIGSGLSAVKTSADNNSAAMGKLTEELGKLRVEVAVLSAEKRRIEEIKEALSEQKAESKAMREGYSGHVKSAGHPIVVERLAALSAKIGEITRTRFTGADAKGLERRLDRVDRRLDRIESTLKKVK